MNNERRLLLFPRAKWQKVANLQHKINARGWEIRWLFLGETTYYLKRAE